MKYKLCYYFHARKAYKCVKGFIIPRLDAVGYHTMSSRRDLLLEHGFKMNRLYKGAEGDIDSAPSLHTLINDYNHFNDLFFD